MHDLTRLAALIRREREPLLARWREQVRALPGAEHLDAPTLNDHLPGLLEELAEALDAGSEETIAEALKEGTPPNHGLQRLADGFDIGEVVAEYNILRGSIHDLAEANGVRLNGRAFHILNRVLDGAIGLAVETYATGRAEEVRCRREEYLSFVAHDLRTPLNAIALAARVLDDKLPSENGNAESVLIKTLHRNVRQVEALVGKVLEENSGPQTEDGPGLERRNFDLWPLVETLVRDLQPVAGNESTHLANLVPVDLVVFADAGQLKRIFQNLIGNAIGYTPHGEVSIGAEEHAKEGTVECWVTDNGAGIPAELLGAVFEKGESDPEKDNGGSGLGLAIVKTFVEAHGGWVRADSVVGKGTTVRLSLPLRDEGK